MNKRIKELANQAYRLAYPITSLYEDGGIDRGNNEFEAKFAELLIQECMNAVCDPGTTYLESMTESSSMYAARERIRKHFGVNK